MVAHPPREKVEHLPNVRVLNILLLLSIFEGVQDVHLLSVGGVVIILPAASWPVGASKPPSLAGPRFGLHTPPATPAPSYRRLSRYDQTGLIWLLRGRPVVALSTATAAIKNASVSITLYRRHPLHIVPGLPLDPHC